MKNEQLALYKKLAHDILANKKNNTLASSQEITLIDCFDALDDSNSIYTANPKAANELLRLVTSLEFYNSKK